MREEPNRTCDGCVRGVGGSYKSLRRDAAARVGIVGCNTCVCVLSSVRRECARARANTLGRATRWFWAAVSGEEAERESDAA